MFCIHLQKNLKFELNKGIQMNELNLEIQEKGLNAPTNASFD